MKDHIEEALAIFSDPNRSELEREKALEMLKGFPSDEVIAALIAALHDPDVGVRWSASEVLALMGDSALKPLLLELASTRNDVNLRNSALHILHTSRGENVQMRTAALQKALKVTGPIAQIKSMEAANQLLIELS